MFRKLLLLILIAGSAPALAQVNVNKPKAEPKKTTTETDYKQVGAPMPALRLLKYVDTSKARPADVAAPKADTVKEETVRGRKRRIHPALQKTDSAVSPANTSFLTDKDFDNGANLFVMMFNPTCSHCEDETELLEKNIFLFHKSKIILLANPMMWEYVPNFVKSFHVAEYPTMTVAADSSGFINKVFLYSALPQINIYSAERKLLRSFSGEVIVDSLKPYIQ